LINGKTTALRLTPAPGKGAGDFVSFGRLFGESGRISQDTYPILSKQPYFLCAFW
jgi:uncharacterized protein (UPF0210 family)